MDETELILALRAHRHLPFAGPFALSPIQRHVYRLAAGPDTFLLKWIDDRDQLGTHEILVGETWPAAAAISAPRLVATVRLEGGRIALWEWVKGDDLGEKHRPLLPEAFAALGRFHAASRHDGPLRASPRSDSHHPTVPALVAAEQDRLAPLVDDDVRLRFTRLLRRLEHGFPTIVHGDVHPGNIVRAGRGLTFVDWSMSRPSLNLFDLEYIESIPLDPPLTHWTYMGPAEAPAILAAYFAAAGMTDPDPMATHLAVVAWQLACGLEAVAARPDGGASAEMWRHRLHQVVSAMDETGGDAST